MKRVIAMMLISVIAGCRPAAAPAGERAAAPKIASTIAKEQKEFPMTTQKATFAAGCFWGVEAAFRQVEGVVSTSVGYTGGHKADPTYKEVCADRTGHAEAVEVVFDPTKVSYERLLEVFWDTHDPTTVNRQGPDVGSQYRSAIFFHSPEQESAAKASKEKLAASGKHRRPVVTEITAATTYYLAEEYHQQYIEKTGQAACGGH